MACHAGRLRRPAGDRRSHVIHAAVLQGPAGRSFKDAAIRLLRYEGMAERRRDDGADEPRGAGTGMAGQTTDE